MIFRALFWVAVVAVLMPHEPDLGLGRPSADGAQLPSAIGGLIQSADPQAACSDHVQGCVAALGFLDMLQNTAIASLSEVKSEIEQSQRERADRLAYNG
jgi:hypothetical protein